MRGFRASRASQNFKSSRYGREWNPQTKNEPQYFGHNSQQAPQSDKPDLPAWLKMPTTPQPSTTAKAPRAVKKTLRLVSTTEPTVKAVATTTATTKPKTTARKTGTTSIKTKTTTTRKRKTAA